MEKFHGKRDVGSSRIRGHNLVKYWDEADLYKYGENPDVMIYQKVYTTFDYDFQKHFEGIQILDVCDPDWKDTPDIYIKQTMDLMEAVVTPTESLQKYLQQMTDTPVRVIKDRFDMEEFPIPKVHKGPAETVGWFGYAHNADTIKFAVPSLENRGLRLLVISNEDPAAYRWANDSKAYEAMYESHKFEHPQAYIDFQAADIAIFPGGLRPFDDFKSDNKAIISWLCGVPVARDADELDSLLTDEARNKAVSQQYDKLKKEYDCRRSVEEYKELIKELSGN